MLHKSGDYTCWCSVCRAQSSSFKHICKRGLCICRAPSHYCHLRQKKLKRWPPGDQIQSMERGAAGYQHEVSPWSECSPLSSQKAIKLLLINNKGKLKKTPSAMFALFQYGKYSNTQVNNKLAIMSEKWHNLMRTKYDPVYLWIQWVHKCT